MEIERYFVIALSGTNVLSHQSGVFMLKDVAPKRTSARQRIALASLTV
jgi:hypothetical protein